MLWAKNRFYFPQVRPTVACFRVTRGFQKRKEKDFAQTIVAINARVWTEIVNKT